MKFLWLNGNGENRPGFYSTFEINKEIENKRRIFNRMRNSIAHQLFTPSVEYHRLVYLLTKISTEFNMAMLLAWRRRNDGRKWFSLKMLQASALYFALSLHFKTIELPQQIIYSNVCFNLPKSLFCDKIESIKPKSF